MRWSARRSAASFSASRSCSFGLEDGTPVALEDRCAHRHLPLSMGKLVGDTLQCHYHGLRYDKTGACVRVPGQDMIPRSARVKSYPVVERYHWLWIWMGDPALADPDKITDFHWLDDPSWGAKPPISSRQGQLAADRRQPARPDPSGLRARNDDRQLRARRQRRGQGTRAHDNVVVTRWIIDSPAPPTFIKAGGFTSNVDRWQIINFTPPAFLRLDVGATPTGTGAPEGQARRRHRHVESQCHHAGDGGHQPLLLGPGAQFRRPQSEDHRHGRRADPHRVPGGRGGVRGAAAQPGR